MDTEIDRMMLLRKLSIICGVLIVFFVALVVGVVIFMNTGDYAGKNSDFAVIETSQEVAEKSFSFEPTEQICIFSDSCRKERTLFTNAIPNVKVVNSNEYSVKVKTNGDLLDKLDIFVDNGRLYVNFKSENYNSVARNGKEYNGLYVDCTIFEITVYAPVTFMHSSAEINLDFQAPQADGVIIIVDGEVREGRVYDVNSNTLGLSFSGKSNVKVEGCVKIAKELVAKHNTTIDATNLNGPTAYKSVPSQIFGFCKIVERDDAKYSLLTVGFAISLLLILVPAILAVVFVILWIKFLKQKQEIDLWIEKVNKEENYLTIPQKTDKNLLQNDE